MTQTEKKYVIFRQAGLRYDNKKLSMITVLKYNIKSLQTYLSQLESYHKVVSLSIEFRHFFKIFLKKRKIGF